jgi:hypothetical protein
MMFVSGAILGLSLALGLGAAQKAKDAPAKETPLAETHWPALIL